MLRTKMFSLALALIGIPSAAICQVSAGVRIGTLGVGPELALGINSRIAIRGGIGVTKYHYDGTVSDKRYSIDTPSSIWNIGVELSPFANAFHLSAGVLHRPQFDLTGTYTGTTRIGNNDYAGTVRLVGNVKNTTEIGPYAGLGFGRMTKKGFGVSFDLGVATLGDGKLSFTQATCTASNGQPCPNQSQFQSDVNTEAAKASNDFGKYLKWHPILSLSLHYGFGPKS